VRTNIVRKFQLIYNFAAKSDMGYTTYLFDFDYTLADSSRGIVTCFRNVLNKHGYTNVTDEDIKRTIGRIFFYPDGSNG
jgi:hypothetical protein